METLKFKGELEVDRNRGVIYFHSDKGYSALRICRLKEYMNEVTNDSQIDITIYNGDLRDILEDIVTISVTGMVAEL